ncbi:MAG: class I SAM-dependent methyltransferase [Desulfarculaceae bacterium]|nr:class I SAM-dependent methyltransferase [Desulfarculaceae bacterium]MCF8072104.1 class I SAM-dependent methyltransferase [Desulfarculaceae bacterium]MCF8100025.1 class I SAM-dependent methyltransferase [Desulfarculaceae bacterium]
MKEQDIRPADIFARYLELAKQDAHDFFQEQGRFVAVACPVCAEDRPRDAFVKDGFSYVVCQACGSLYNTPRPPLDMIGRYYEQAPSVKYWATDFYKATEAARRESMFAPRAAHLAGLARDYGMEGGSLLDLGSGFGILLEEVAKTGAFAQVRGVDCSPDLAAVCRDKGFEVIGKNVEDLTPADGPVDLAVSFEVLEHLFDPAVFLRGAGQVLRPGGLLLLTTLTSDGFDLRLLGPHAKAVQPPYHINFPSRAGLERLLARSGFKLLELTTPGRLDVDIVRNTLAENPAIELDPLWADLVGSEDEKLRAGLQEFLAQNRLSSHLMLLVAKEAA